jgi:hypothetical protein
MKYLCLIYASEEHLDGVPVEVRAAVERECLHYEQDLQRSGILLGVQALQPVRTAATLRVHGGGVSITDGPFAETKEQLAGFYLIDARDLNDAIRLAARIPPARLGCVEVRPIRELPAPIHSPSTH